MNQYETAHAGTALHETDHGAAQNKTATRIWAAQHRRGQVAYGGAVNTKRLLGRE
jgi:hypothetical protein